MEHELLEKFLSFLTHKRLRDVTIEGRTNNPIYGFSTYTANGWGGRYDIKSFKQLVEEMEKELYG